MAIEVCSVDLWIVLSRTCNLTKYGCMNKFNGIMKINALNQDARRCQTQRVTKAEAKQQNKGHICQTMAYPVFKFEYVKNCARFLCKRCRSQIYITCYAM